MMARKDDDRRWQLRQLRQIMADLDRTGRPENTPIDEADEAETEAEAISDRDVDGLS